MIRLIAAIDRQNGIAKQGFQPWYIPDDEAYFTKQTQSFGGTVLVGSTTFKTFKGPLTGRQNYVLTKEKEPIPGVTLVHDLDKFLKDFRNDKDLWVIGGANVFAQVIESGQADELYLTHIQADFGCNQFFPAYDGFELAEQSDLHEQNGFIYNFARYAKTT